MMISVVVPVFESRDSLELLVERLEAALADLGREYELILVDDGSRDGSWQELRRLRAGRRCLRIARSLVTQGQHNAILCGFSLVRGDVVVTMDDDLQHPPEEIGRLVGGLDAGHDLVIAAYESKRHTRLRNLGSAVVDRLQRRIFSLPREFQLTSFRAARRVVVDHALRMGGAYPFITAMLLVNSSRRANVPVRHEARALGASTYTMLKSARLTLNLLLGYSSYPLYFVAALCGLGLLFSGGLAAAIVWMALRYGTAVPGWASTVVILTFFNSLTLLSLVIFGLYLSRISRQLAGRQSSFRVDEIL